MSHNVRAIAVPLVTKRGNYLLYLENYEKYRKQIDYKAAEHPRISMINL